MHNEKNILAGERTQTEIAKETLAEIRTRFHRHLELCDVAETIMVRMPLDAIPNCSIVSDSLIIYNQDRSGALAVIRALGGKWAKTLNRSNPERIDYTQTINGMEVQMWGAMPPESCRIITEEIEIPAHKKTKRTLVCS